MIPSLKKDYTNQKLITQLIQSSHIYGTMYGLYKHQDKIIKIKSSKLRYVENWGTEGPGLIYIWGWPGPDGNTYLFSDYGKTWAFTKKELENENYDIRNK